MTDDLFEGKASDELGLACERVGRFFYHFALLEQAIGHGVAKLLNLDSIQAQVVMANLDFNRKVNILFSAEAEAAALPELARKKEIESTYSTIMKLNDRRIVLAHSSFNSIGSDAVRFDRATAKKRLMTAEEVWTTVDFERHYRAMEETALVVDRLVAEMEPYTPSLDLRDPRNLGLAWAIGIL